MIELIIPTIISCLLAFFIVFFITPPLIKILEKKNFVVKDVNKKGNVMIARPGGLSIILGIIISELIFYVFLQLNEILSIIIHLLNAIIQILLFEVFNVKFLAYVHL